MNCKAKKFFLAWLANLTTNKGNILATTAGDATGQSASD